MSQKTKQDWNWSKNPDSEIIDWLIIYPRIVLHNYDTEMDRQQHTKLAWNYSDNLENLGLMIKI